MAKYAHINSNNIIQGWYDDSIHTNIPTPKIQVTDEQHQTATQNNHNHCTNAGVTSTVTLERTNQEKVIEAYSYLGSTDWYIVRNQETGAAIPSEVTTKRTEARQTINDLEE